MKKLDIAKTETRRLRQKLGYRAYQRILNNVGVNIKDDLIADFNALYQIDNRLSVGHLCALMVRYELTGHAILSLMEKWELCPRGTYDTLKQREWHQGKSTEAIMNNMEFRATLPFPLESRYQQ